MDATTTRNAIETQLHCHEELRRHSLNLIASENVMSPAVRQLITNDLHGRYADYPGRDPSKRRYRGNQYIAEIERIVTGSAKKLFDASFVEIRPVSGHIAGAAVLMGICRPGDVVLELGREGGSHREAGRLSTASLASLRVTYLPFDGARFNLDVPAALELIETTRPRAVVLGTSNFLFPHPVREIAAAVRKVPGSVLVFDASHILGFLAAGAFQDPLREGADIVFGSTHKTLPGPQGGIIFSNRDDLMEPVTEALVPALVTNHHPFRMPALGVALEEMGLWGRAYTAAMVRNANALGDALQSRGLATVNVEGRHTESNTVLLCVAQFGKAEAIAELLEKAGIIVTSTLLPEFWGGEGIRLGSQEFTRLGGNEEVARAIGNLIADVLIGEMPTEIACRRARSIAETLGPVRFTWEAAS